MSLLKTYKQLKEKYPEYILFFEADSAIQTVNDDAFAFSKIIKAENLVTQKLDYYSFSFPKGDLERYLTMALNSGRKIAIVSEIANLKEKNLFTI